MTITFFVPGIPISGGSKRAFIPRRKDGSMMTRASGAPMVVITDDAGEKNREWKQQGVPGGGQKNTGLFNILAKKFGFA